jgi:hypothetical protein
LWTVYDDKLGVIGQTTGERLTRTTTLTQTTTNTASVTVISQLSDCYCLGYEDDSVTVTVDDAADCLCQVTNINPNQVVLQNVGTGGKGSDATRKMVMIVHAVDAPGATCDPGETSGPTSVNLKMVDDTGNILIDSSKTIVCEGGGATTNLKRTVFFRGPLNCENGAVPGGSSTGTITTTGSAPGTADYVESTNIKCFE